MTRPAVFLDRDGTLNVEKQYLYRIDDWEWIEGAIGAIKLINTMGYLAIVVTNQAGIARGYYREKDVISLHQYVDKVLAAEGAWIDAYYYCPHHPEYGVVKNCQCRKPNPGMFINAQNDFNIDLSGSWMIGDKVTDTEAATHANVSPILVMTGYGEDEQENLSSSTPRKKDILEAVEFIKASSLHE